MSITKIHWIKTENGFKCPVCRKEIITKTEPLKCPYCIDDDEMQEEYIYKTMREDNQLDL